MRKCCVALLCVLILSALVSCSLAQTVPCPEARVTLTVPDTWTIIPLAGRADPDLCLLLESKDVSLSVYAADTGGLVPESFQVFTGDETEHFTVTVSGVEMTCVAGTNDEGEYRIYTWLDRRSQIQFWFLITGHPEASRRMIEEIMDTLIFE